MCERFVTGDVNLSYLRLGFLIHIDEHLDISLAVMVGLLQHLDFGIVETFFGEVLLDHCLCTVSEVRRHLCTFADAYLDFDVLLLALLQAEILDFAHTRTLLEAYLQPNLVALNLRGGNLHVGEQTLLPEAADTLCYLVARNLNLVAYRQTGETDEHKILVTGSSGHTDAGYLVRLASHAVLNLRRRSSRRRYRRAVLCISHGWQTQKKKKYICEELFQKL